MKYSISKAAKIAGITRKTLYKHIEKKPISVEKDDNGRPIIDASELIRVYGDKCKFVTEAGNKDTGQGIHPPTEVSNSETKTEIAVTQKELEMIKAQMASERDNFEEQIDYLRNKLDESNSESRKLTALLTDQSGQKQERVGTWEKSIKALEARLANQEKAEKDREQREQKILRQNQALRKALKEEREKGFIKKLFG